MDKEKLILKDIFLFKGVNESLFDSIEFSRAVTFNKGEVIYGTNSFKKAIGVILSGKAQARNGKGKTLLSVFSAGAVFGAAALFTKDSCYVSQITAQTTCKVQFIEEDLLEALFKTEPQTAINYISFLSDKIRYLNEKITIFTGESAESRLYSYLIANCDEKGDLPDEMCKKKLADALNMGRTSLYRSLDNLEQKNLIIRTKRKVKVLL